MELQDLQGKVAVVTGGGTGIGAAVARALVAHGVRVVLAGRRPDRLHAVEAELGTDCALAVPADVAERRDVDHLMAETLRRFGRVDILLANAGQFRQGRVADVDTEVLVSIVNANVIGVLRCIKGVLPHMIAQHSGDIIVTSSISGHRDIENEAVYSASKHAVNTLVNLLRAEVAVDGLRVAGVAPGIVLNEIWHVTDPAEVEAGLRARSGLCSEDIAELIVYMLRLPRRITLRDVVALPQAQVI
jgi:ribitol 2-dehydrogenase